MNLSNFSSESLRDFIINECHKKLEQGLIEGINHLVDDGLLVVIPCGTTIVENLDQSNRFEIKTKVRLELRDKQIITDLRKKIERLEVINKELNEIICNK